MHVPTAFEFPFQLRRHFDERPDLFRKRGRLLVAVERQNARDTGNMVVQAVFQERYGPDAALQPPLAVKKFWNAAVLAVAAVGPPAFRLTGSYSVNKTDAKRFAPRFLSKGELALFQRAADENAHHRETCAIAVQRRKGKKRKRAPPKMDDLIDAALQAIYAHHTERGIGASDPRGPAMKRLKRLQQQPTLDEVVAAQTKRPRKRRRARKK